MLIHNVRLGFATNSSSSHSIILLDKPASEEGIAGYPVWDGYGWENFTLVEQEEKRDYLATQLAGWLKFDHWNSDDERNFHALAVTRALLGYKFERPTYIDHQSQWMFPTSWDGSAIDSEWVEALRDFIDRDEVVILGGNDNSDGHPLVSGRDVDGPYASRLWNSPMRDTYKGSLVARNDGTHWVFFDRSDGYKVRVSLESPSSEWKTPDRAPTPELVDIKITDYCPFGCEFCYQDSTLEGKHASLESVLAIAEELGRRKVFEVALGGGEPTLHPDFIPILKAFRNNGVVPNFTTRNLKWLSHDTAAEVMNEAGAFAYSVHKPSDVSDLARAVEDSIWSPSDKGFSWRAKYVVIHVVMGTVVKKDFEMILDLAQENRFGVTLLGWKRLGRAQSAPPHPYMDWWLESVRKVKMSQIGIDTTLASEADAAGQLDGVPRWMYHIEDGKFSCYIDAVSGTLAPSSWEPERGSWPIMEGLELFRNGLPA